MGKTNEPDTTDNHQRYNYLAAAEIDAEENYNQIDGIINNTKKPSILEHLRQFKPPPSEYGDKAERSAELT